MKSKLTEDRARVLQDLKVNMVVEAGAGTGKTTLLIKRLCLAVLVQGIEIEKIVALTFTEKAAAEIKNRLVTALHTLIQDIETETKGQPPADESLLHFIHEQFNLAGKDLLPRAQAALAHLDRASVGTIHSFCADILKTFPLEAGLSPQAQIDPGPRASRIFEARWSAFLDRELGLQAPRAEVWKEILPEISLDELKDFAWELCSGKIETYDYFSHASLLTNVCEEKAKLAQDWSSAYLDPKRPSPRKAEKLLVWAAQTLLQAASFLRSRQMDSQAPALPEPGAFPTAAPKGWEEERYEEARGLVQFARKMQPYKQHIFCQAFALVKDVVADVRQTYAQEGVLSFDDLIVKTRNLVQQNLYVRRMLKEKLDVLYIDEFQDTDPVQGELLLFLAEQKSSNAARWQDVKLTPGKLIVVGDPKQSIYRFRGADITAYELFTQLILSQGGEKCFLRGNYRSVPDIVATANAVCRRVMIQQTAFQPAYEPIYPIKPAGVQAVQWLFVSAPQGPGYDVDDLRDNQAERIADWINQHVGKLTLSDGRKLAYKDIAILSRASTTSGPYTDALRRRAIPFTCDGEKDFFKRQDVNDFLNFLRVVADPTDKTALVGVLRSPLGGLSDEAIYQLAHQNALDLSAQPQAPEVQRLYALILTFARQAGRQDVSDFLEEVLAATFLPDLCAAAYDGEKTIEVLTQVVSGASQVLADRPTSLGQFLAAMETLLLQTPEALSATPADALDAVSVMTVHKSKGLDFPVVILADLSKQDSSSSASRNKYLFSWQYHMHGLRVGKICDANLAFLEEEQKKHERCEEIRILYVALTRAKEKLILVADDRKGAQKAARGFVQAGLFPDGATPCVGGDEVAVPVSYFAYERPENFVYHVAKPSVPAAITQKLLAWKTVFSARCERYEKLQAEQRLSPSARVEQAGLLSPQQQAAAELGTVCHRALQILVAHPELSGQAAAHRAVAETGFPAREQEAGALLSAFCQAEIFREIQTCRLLGAEMPFSYLAESGLVENGLMDVVLERADGSVWIVDYKTDQIPADGPQALLEKYRPQLSVYQQAARQLFAGKPVRCSAVFLRAFAAVDL